MIVPEFVREGEAPVPRGRAGVGDDDSEAVACGTGGMLTLAENVLQQIAKEREKQVSTHLFGQEINGEIYAICKADFVLK